MNRLVCIILLFIVLLASISFALAMILLPRDQGAVKPDPEQVERCGKHLLLYVLSICQRSCTHSAGKTLVEECVAGKTHSENEVMTVCCPDMGE